MPLPKKTQKSLDRRLALMDDAVDSINVEDNEVKIFKSLRRFLFKELDLDSDGNIKKTAKNLKAVQRMTKLRNIILDDAYKAKVGKFIGTFNAVKSLSDDYITDL